MTLLYDPPQDMSHDPSWVSKYGRARPGDPTCGAQIHPVIPNLVCTRTIGHPLDWHIACTHQSHEELGETRISPNGTVSVQDGRTMTPWPAGKPFPSNVLPGPSKSLPAGNGTVRVPPPAAPLFPPPTPGPGKAPPPLSQAPSTLANKKIGRGPKGEHPMFAKYRDEGEMTDWDLLPDA